jgi:hypothetical protein
MANHGKTGASLDAYRSKKLNHKHRNPSKGLMKRREDRAKVQETKKAAAEQATPAS